MVDPEIQRKQIEEFLLRYQEEGMLSTSAKVVHMTDVMYNVSGSTTDPKIDGKSWKQLLLTYGIDDDCYVTNEPAPITSSHPNFSVGGHMTLNRSGHVEVGEESFLMPLCYWHNSTRRNHKPFEHDKTRMLRLEGYMLGDVDATFFARMETGNNENCRIVFETNAGWDTKQLSNEDQQALQSQNAFHLDNEAESARFFTLKRDAENGRFFVDFVSQGMLTRA